MTVRELISELLEHDMDAQVCVPCSGDADEYADISNITPSMYGKFVYINDKVDY